MSRRTGWCPVGVTPTAGGIVFFADMAGTLSAIDTASGKSAWSTKLPGAAGGGVVSYLSRNKQHLAVVAGTDSPIWPVPKTTAKIVIFGLP